ncbi:MAG: sigma-70 family RNA polymerase sigma factor [Armatimonadota bacterium]|nr:sigma-70 family RNA polymerase sigma factor [Armatimonadota bacterium]MDW8026127.1 sigma-70 family RNA polymerase sigma factor [Armatimonadota bacterium]
MEDNELIRRCLQGDKAAFDELVHRYRDRVYGIALYMLRDIELAEDIAQEAFLRVFQKLGLFDQRKGAFSKWVATLTVRLCLNALKKKNRDGQLLINTSELDGNETQQQDFSETPEEVWWLNERRRIIKDLLEILPPMQRATLLLRYGEDLSIQEIAEALKVPVGTVKAWLFRGRETLRRKLKEAGVM